MKYFCSLYRLNSLNNKPTCCKNLANPPCIDLILTNCPKYFQNITVNEARLSGIQKMVGKTNFRKLETKIVQYRNFKYFTKSVKRY